MHVHVQDAGEGRRRNSLQQPKGNHSCPKQINIRKTVVLRIYAGINSIIWQRDYQSATVTMLTTCTPPLSFGGGGGSAKTEVLHPLQ